jgi:hypothetical protein
MITYYDRKVGVKPLNESEIINLKPIIKIILVLHIVVLCIFILHNFSGKRYNTPNDMIVPVTYESNTTPSIHIEPDFNTQSDSLTSTPSPVETVSVSPEDIESINQIISDQSTNVLKGNIKIFEEIYMAIFRNGNELTASYITSDNDTEIYLTGSIDIHTASFILSNEDKSISFQGLIEPGTQKGDILTGVFTNKKDKVEVNLYLVLYHSIESTIDKRYPLVEGTTEDVETFAKEIKSYIKNDKRKEFAELIHYPISVKIQNANKTIYTPDEFIQSYEDIITDHYKYKIDVSYTRYLFSNDMGVMMGNGDIWFNSLEGKGLKIIAINN